jgi:hypothetical protein
MSKLPTINQKKMNRILLTTNIRVSNEEKVRNSKKGYLVSFDPSPVIINMETGEQVEYTNLTPEEYISCIEDKPKPDEYILIL